MASSSQALTLPSSEDIYTTPDESGTHYNTLRCLGMVNAAVPSDTQIDWGSLHGSMHLYLYHDNDRLASLS